jgi:hypothetical protein
VGGASSELGAEGDTESPWVGKVSGALGFNIGAVGRTVLKNGLCAIDAVGDSAAKPTIKQNNFRRSLSIGVLVPTLRGQAAVTAAIAHCARLFIELAAAAAISCLRIFHTPDVSSNIDSLNTTAVPVLL